MILNSKKGGKRLPTLTNPGSAADLASGKQLIDQNGEIVTGNLQVVSSVGGRPYQPQFKNFYDTDYIGFEGGRAVDVILKAGIQNMELYGLASDFGNATAADVAAGKTFTSAEGVNVSGTAKALGSLVTVQSVVDHGNRYVMQMALSGSGGIYPFSNVGVNSVQFTCRVGEYVTLIGSSNFTGYDSGDFTLITDLNVGNFTVALYRCDGTDASYIGFRT